MEENLKNKVWSWDKKIASMKARIREDEGILECNKKHIFDFLAFIGSNWSQARVDFYSGKLHIIAREVDKDFKGMTEDEMKLFVPNLLDNPNWSETTKDLFKAVIKRFWRWLYGDVDPKLHPPQVAWLRRSKIEPKVVAEDLLTDEEITKIIDQSHGVRDKTFVALLAETGMRTGEICTIRIKDVSFDSKGTKVSVDGKTGQRTVRVIGATRYLQMWMECHPKRNEPNAPLFCNMRRDSLGKPLTEACMRCRLQKASKRAGIKKRVTMRVLRHGTATQLVKMGVNPNIMNHYLGWKGGSKMSATYVHLVGKDVDDALFKAYGMEDKIETSQDERKRICARCNHVNDFSTSSCLECGLPLRMTAEVLDMDKEKDEFIRKVKPLMRLLEDPDFQKLVAKKMARG